MNVFLLSHELCALLLGLALLLVDLWLPPSEKRKLGYAAAAGVGVLLAFSLFEFDIGTIGTQYAFGGMFVLDPLALFFKRFFLLAALLVLLMSVEFADRVGQRLQLAVRLSGADYGDVLRADQLPAGAADIA